MKNTSNRSFIWQSLLLVSVCITKAEKEPPPYTPIESITINCGSFNDVVALDGRPWTGENSSKFPVIHSQSKQSVFLSGSPGDVRVPYTTSRLSYSEFTYMIPLTNGQKFIRLHFYLDSYPGFDLSKAFFTVKAGPFTLLKNFSALLHAQGRQTLAKEFCVSVKDGQSLNITFTPSSAISDAYAFISGIEIVSMPTNLYYRPPSDDGLMFVGQDNLYRLGYDTALEMMHRINVGGSEIRPVEDTGMYRSWSTDEDYLTDEGNLTTTLPVNTSIHLNFSAIPAFVAPDSFYRVARSMGTDGNMNKKNNLTWNFPVDSGFIYLVRLHFCEFQIEISEPGNRVFEIFLANLTAEARADVITWSGGNGIPIYRDYAVVMNVKGNEKIQNLSIKLHPAPAWITNYSDPLLNGVEIFKLSYAGSLSAPNPDPITSLFLPLKPPIRQSGKNRKLTFHVAVPISCFVAILLLFFLILKISSNGKSKKNTLAYPSHICSHFSLGEIKSATNNFNPKFIIGRGGFGDVYKGVIGASSTPVAIKRLNPGSQQGMHEFKTEIELLSHLRHQNLVSLIGYCEDNHEMILLYDYMVNGTLRDHLYNTTNPPLPWEVRLKMCIGAAHGLNYLHRGPDHTIIHRDVKTANILLSEKWVAKVSDFGLSKMNDMSNTHISTAVKGSFGYLDPEYFRLQHLTEKSDVYSFGVVLCEVLCARAPVDRTRDHMEICLADWAKHCHCNGILDQIIDPFLQDKITPPSLLKFCELAISCLASEGIKRPSMSEVVLGLEHALKLQESEMNTNNENQANDLTIMDYHVLFTSGSGSLFNTGR